MGTVLIVAVLLLSLISCPVNAAEPVEHLTPDTESISDKGCYADHQIDHGFQEQSTQKSERTQSEYRVYRACTGDKVEEFRERQSGEERGKDHSEHRHGGTSERNLIRSVEWWNARWIGAGVTFGLSLLGALIIWESSQATSRRRTS
ncbi:hypothetical protein [Methanopyrus sp.]